MKVLTISCYDKIYKEEYRYRVGLDDVVELEVIDNRMFKVTYKDHEMLVTTDQFVARSYPNGRNV